MRSLAPAQLRRIEREALLWAEVETAKRRALRQPLAFADYVANVSPAFAEVPPHLRLLYELVDRARHEQVFATISMPPRHGKSETLRHALAYFVSEFGERQNAYATYGDALARHSSMRIRRLAQRSGLRLASSKVNDWQTNLEGGLIATSVGGSITGRGITGLAVADDLIKGAMEAQSRAKRDATWTWFLDDFMSRLEGGASVLVINTRWHLDDIIGRLIGDDLGLPWEHYRMPAVHDGAYNPVDEREAAEFEPLWLGVNSKDRTREGALAWYARARKRGEYAYKSLYQQTPVPRSGRLFNEPFYTSDTAMNGHLFIAADLAISESSKADYTVAGALLAWVQDGELYGRLLDITRGQWGINDIVPNLAAFQRRWHNATMGIEAVGGFAGVPDLIRNINRRLRILPIKPRGDKYQRAIPAAEAFNLGRLQLPLGAKWVPDLLAELQDFTGISDKHDDQVDMLAHVWKMAADALIGEDRTERRTVIDRRYE